MGFHRQNYSLKKRYILNSEKNIFLSLREVKCLKYIFEHFYSVRDTNTTSCVDTRKNGFPFMPCVAKNNNFFLSEFWAGLLIQHLSNSAGVQKQGYLSHPLVDIGFLPRLWKKFQNILFNIVNVLGTIIKVDEHGNCFLFSLNLLLEIVC